MLKTIFLILGFKQQASGTNYQWLVSCLKDKNSMSV
jgi:hypothetical protein